VVIGAKRVLAAAGGVGGRDVRGGERESLQAGGGAGWGGQDGSVIARGHREDHGPGGGRLPVDEQHLDGCRLAAKGHLVAFLAAGGLEGQSGRENMFRRQKDTIRCLHSGTKSYPRH